MSRKSKLDDLMEAVTFAEAGETETARRIAQDVFPDAPRVREQILSVSGAQGFSQRMIEHCLAIAARLQYGLIALTVPPGVVPLAVRLGMRGRGRAWASADAFRARAEQRGIPFVHTVGRGAPEQAVVEARKRFRRIAFLVVEPDLAPESHLARLDLPIFYVER
jgi:hypothetical protein